MLKIIRGLHCPSPIHGAVALANSGASPKSWRDPWLPMPIGEWALPALGPSDPSALEESAFEKQAGGRTGEQRERPLAWPIHLVHLILSSLQPKGPKRGSAQVAEVARRGGHTSSHLLRASTMRRPGTFMPVSKAEALTGKGLNQLPYSPVAQPGCTCRSQNSHPLPTVPQTGRAGCKKNPGAQPLANCSLCLFYLCAPVLGTWQRPRR